MRRRCRRNARQVRCAWLVPTTLTPNGRWGEYAKGEWWITPDNDVIELGSGDLDADHELYALSIIFPDRDEVPRALLDSVREYKWLPDWAKKLELELGTGDEYELGGADVMMAYARYIDDEHGARLVGSLEVWQELRREDAKYVLVKRYGAIRVMHTNFDVWRLDERNIKRIQDFLFEQIDEGDIGGPNDRICLKEYCTDTFECVKVRDFLLAKHPGDVWVEVR